MRALMMASALALAACNQPAAPASAPTPAATPAQTQVRAAAPAPNDCPASASTHWNTGDQQFTITATAVGAACAGATLNIEIKDAQGVTVHTGSYPSSAMQEFADPESLADMNRMLSEWITPAGASMDSTGDLADWAVGAPAPSNENMPFTPATRITRDIYERLHASDEPMYCYQQTDANSVCFAMDGAVLRLLGFQEHARE